MALFSSVRGEDAQAKSKAAALAANECAFALAAFESSGSAIMMVDRDFRVLRVNEATRKLLRENEKSFRAIWPVFSADGIVGACIDMFHKNPAHQRALLADPSRLPYRTEISVGDKKFSLSVGAVRNASGEYVGNSLEWADVTEARLNRGRLSALRAATATAEFKPTGEIYSANNNFLQMLGYTESELQSLSHAAIHEPEFSQSAAYAEIWEKLRSGGSVTGKYKYLHKSGKEVWVQAAYSPIYDHSGATFAIVAFATDITETELRNLEVSGKLSAIDKGLGVVEFAMDGTILSSNANYLDLLGYAASDVVGKHHTAIVSPEHAKSEEFADLWRRLRAGEFVSKKSQRVGKNGRKIWIHAIYSPIVDMKGRPAKIVAYVSDVTAGETEMQKMEAERAEQAAAQTQVVKTLAESLRRLSSGDLRARIEQAFSADYEGLRKDFNDAMTNLEQSMEVIASNASSMASNSVDVARAADDLSRRTEQQAATLEQTAATLDEITATVRKTAEGSMRANAVVDSAKKDAGGSGEIVGQAVTAMSEIERSSSQIAQIIGVIDEISFQTNLLALNAGVEAARAGEAGRGFAVVASEVRALAQRTSDAAKEIKTLISTSTQQVKAGVRLVGDAGAALNTIVGQISEISTVVAEIAASAQEQSVALSEVNTAVNQMDQATQQNAAMVEETTAASQALQHDAGELTRLVARFSLSTTPERPSASPPPAKNPIAAAQARIASFAGKGAAAAALRPAPRDDDWESF